MLAVRVRARLLPENRVVELELVDDTVAELLRRLGLGREGGVVARAGRPLLEEERLADGEEVTVYRVVSGG